jgi:hypothetical protein
VRSLLVRTGLASALMLGALVLASPAQASTSAPGNPTVSVGGVAPNSAHGCDRYVCIAVWGSGLHVDEIDSTAGALLRQMCTYWRIYANGSLIGSSGWVCGNPGDVVQGAWRINRNFANHTQLCVDWYGISGRPCETVHS